MRGEPVYACPKDARGTQRIKEKVARKATVSIEDRLKQASKRRDGNKCRWPHTDPEEAARCRMLRVESAHLTHKGMGGDKQLIRTKKELLVTFGLQCHDLFDGRIGGGRPRRVRFLTEKKADGACAFEVRHGGQWFEIGREISPGVLAK